MPVKKQLQRNFKKAPSKNISRNNIHRPAKNNIKHYTKRRSKAQSLRTQRLCIAVGLGLIFILMMQCVIIKQQRNQEKLDTTTEQVQEKMDSTETKAKESDMIFPSDIRVLINAGNYAGTIHKEIQVTSDKPYIVTENGQETSYPAGEKYSIVPEQKSLKNGKIFITPTEDGKLCVLSITRSYGNPEYRGRLEIEAKEDGLTLINEVDVESYLYAVVPSEMPVSYGAEALKVQAVCARSFAYNQMKSSNYDEYGADLEDSVNSQVYNNVKESPEAIAAVDATKGQILTYEDSIVNTYFFSTSSGHTANSTDVWISDAASPAYLTGHLQAEEEGQLQLAQEEAFQSFIDNAQQYAYFEQDYPWFRWNVTTTAKKLKQTIAQNISSVQDKIKVKNKAGQYVTSSVQNIGRICDMNVLKRSDSGVMMELEIKGSKHTIKVTGEYAIRKLLGNNQIPVNLKDGTTSQLSMLPSGYFYIAKKTNAKGKVSSFTFYGGGFGHGVGMSQNGVKAMADKGYTFEQMLSHYYAGTELSIVQHDNP